MCNLITYRSFYILGMRFLLVCIFRKNTSRKIQINFIMSVRENLQIVIAVKKSVID